MLDAFTIGIIVGCVFVLILLCAIYFLYAKYREMKTFVINLQKNAVYQQNILDRITGGSSSNLLSPVSLDSEDAYQNRNMVQLETPPVQSSSPSGSINPNDITANLFPLMGNLMNIFGGSSGGSAGGVVEIIPDDEEEEIKVEQIIPEELEELKKSEETDANKTDDHSAKTDNDSKLSKIRLSEDKIDTGVKTD